MHSKNRYFLWLLSLSLKTTILFSLVSCVNSNHTSDYKKLIAVDVGTENSDPENQDTKGPEEALHTIFQQDLGVEISRACMGAVDPDPTGHDASNDWDGDGIPNSEERVTNPFVADYPRVVTRISAPITMEIRISQTSEEENYTQSLTESDLKETISNCMEDKHYTQAAEKTTPYVVKESLSESGKHAEAFGYENAASHSNEISVGLGADVGVLEIFDVGTDFNFGSKNANSNSNSQNRSFEDSLSQSTMSEKTVFEDVDFTDNLDRNGVEFKNDTVEQVSNNYRKSAKLKQTDIIGPNAGIVRAALYLKNMSVNMPVHISNVKCTLSFRTPGGTFLPIKTFILKNEDYTDFIEDVYGGEELGPFTIEIDNLNTREVRVALANGYVPQIHVVSYDMNRVTNSNYNPGVDNLKIVEETAKARTATVKIIGSGLREIYRVAAFDVHDPTQMDSGITPGISLKKALFNVFHDRIGDHESWEVDSDGNMLTVSDNNLKWKSGAIDHTKHTYSDNQSGNRWRRFETYVKSFVDSNNQTRNVETIKRIEMISKYNPFSAEDNETYDPSEVLSEKEIRKTTFWVIYHNGNYFEGDLNDPIWAGERYEIVQMSMDDFNKHFKNFAYTPFQSKQKILFDTRWNSMTEEPGEFARARYLGKVFPNDIVQLEIDLLQTRLLFDNRSSSGGFGMPDTAGMMKHYYNFNYSFEDIAEIIEGVPGEFSHSVTGGANNIEVKIDNSENALYYHFLVYPQNNPSSVKTISIDRTNLLKNNHVVHLNSNTKDIDSNYIDLTGDAQGLPYVVEVIAYGKSYGHEVATKSQSGKQVAYVIEPIAKPSPFQFTVLEDTDQMNVRIDAANGAEFYSIRCDGPLNYENTNTTEWFKLDSGNNIIQVERPTFEELELNNFAKGLYRVQVFASNKLTEGVEASNGTEFVEIPFDRYINQRLFEPKIATELYDLRAVDIEVNFNDGSGWFRLQTVDPVSSGVVQGIDSSRTIDCFYSSYMNRKEQKYFVNFAPPHGQNAGVPNVFFGGRDSTEVYIRTIPKNKYRDSFWMKPSFDANGDKVTYQMYTDAPRYLTLNEFAENDVTEHWLNMGNNITDATKIEKSVFALNIDGISSTSSVDDFFFSPREQRVYSLKANVTDEMTDFVEGYRPGQPSFSTIPPFLDNCYEMIPGVAPEECIKLPFGDPYYEAPYIKVLNIISGYASEYEIYYVEGLIDTSNILQKAQEDPTGYSWIESVDWLEMKLAYPKENSNTFYNLYPEGTYTFCVAARNKYGLSIPNCLVVNIPEEPLEELPVGRVGYEDNQTAKRNPVVDIRSNGFFISNIYAKNATSYKLYKKDSSISSNDLTDTDVWSATSKFERTSIFVEIQPADWKPYTVRILGFNKYGESGEENTYWETTILPPVSQIGIENAKFTDIEPGVGYFQNNQIPLVNINGQPLREGFDYKYNMALDNSDGQGYNLFDTGISGGFASGKVMRIVVNGINPKIQYGLNPVAKNLGNSITPPQGKFYIDPHRGKFVLPRPVFWSKMEDKGSVIGDYTIVDPLGKYSFGNQIAGNLGRVDSKFNSGLQRVTDNDIDGPGGQNQLEIRPVLNSMSKGTISFWQQIAVTHGAWNAFSCNFDLWLNSNTYIRFTHHYQWIRNEIFVNGTSVASNTDVSVGGLNHYYITFDKNSGISVYVNGSLVMSTSYKWSYADKPWLAVRTDSTSGIAVSSMTDNLKIWDEVISSPSWEYNNRNGREDALHFIYGANYNYKPVLNSSTNPDSGVGYYLPEF